MCIIHNVRANQWFSGKESACHSGNAVNMGQKYPLEDGVANHASILAGEPHGQRSPGSDMTEATEHS